MERPRFPLGGPVNIKPGNYVLKEGVSDVTALAEGTIKLIDFGLTSPVHLAPEKLNEEGGGVELKGIGTKTLMAPESERQRNDPMKVEVGNPFAADVWALGKSLEGMLPEDYPAGGQWSEAREFFTAVYESMLSPD